MTDEKKPVTAGMIFTPGETSVFLPAAPQGNAPVQTEACPGGMIWLFFLMGMHLWCNIFPL